MFKHSGNVVLTREMMWLSFCLTLNVGAPSSTGPSFDFFLSSIVMSCFIVFSMPRVIGMPTFTRHDVTTTQCSADWSACW